MTHLTGPPGPVWVVSSASVQGQARPRPSESCRANGEVCPRHRAGLRALTTKARVLGVLLAAASLLLPAPFPALSEQPPRHGAKGNDPFSKQDHPNRPLPRGAGVCRCLSSLLPALPDAYAPCSHPCSPQHTSELSPNTTSLGSTVLEGPFPPQVQGQNATLSRYPELFCHKCSYRCVHVCVSPSRGFCSFHHCV